MYGEPLKSRLKLKLEPLKSLELQRFWALVNIMKFSKLIVILVVILNTLFAAATLYVFLKTCGEPSALIVAWFGFTTGELWLLAGIKKKKIKKEEGCE